MASIKNSFAAFLVSILLTSGVQGENAAASDIGFETCTYNTDGTGFTVTDGNTDATLIGNKLRTYEILCRKTANLDPLVATTGTTTNLNGPVTIDTATSFTTLCDLIDDTPDILEYLGEGVNGHTIFAPTNAAFNNQPVFLAELQADAIARQEFLQLHILEYPYLTTVLECDEIYYTLNLNGTDYRDQRSKTKCAGVSRSYQIGGGNDDGNLPELGSPTNVFDAQEFQYAVTGNNFALRTTQPTNDFSADVVGCNGVIHVVDNLLLPVDERSSKSGKMSKSAKAAPAKAGKAGPSPKRRELFDDTDTDDHDATEDAATNNARAMAYENRRRRLEALLEPNGNIEQLN